MRRHIMTTLAACSLALGLHGTVGAVIDGPTCKAECAPRIEEQCGALQGKAFKRCKRKLIRACKASDPVVACTTARGPRPGDDEPTPGRGPGDTNAAAVTAALGDRIVTVSSDSFFSSGSIVQTQEMGLCASGSFHLVVTTVTSTTVGDFSDTVDSEDVFDGTWSVRQIDGVQTLELVTGEPEPRRFAVDVVSGQILLDGKAPDVSPNTACGGAGGQPGQPGGDDGGQGDDPVAQLTATLTNQVVVVQERNAGFGTQTTSFALCGSGRFLLDFETAAAPGRVQETIGNWSIRLEQGQPILALAADDGGEQRFAISVDAQNNILLNDIPAQPGNADAISAICPQL